MSKKYFTSVDFDKVFPPEETPVPVTSVVEVPEVTTELDVASAIASISVELELIRSGGSDCCAHAQQFDEKKLPFCIALKQFPLNPSQAGALHLASLAKQDFGDKFASFVLAKFKSIYGSK